MSNLILIVLVGALAIWALNHYGVVQMPAGDIDRRVLQATRGDRALAKRLMRQVRIKYPDKNHEWHVDKVLYDIERDGGYVPPRRRSTPSFNINRSRRRDMMEDMFFIGTVIWFVEMLSSYITDAFRR